MDGSPSDRDLRDLFAAADASGPADDGFSARVSGRLARKEAARALARWANVGAFGLVGLIVLTALALALGPILNGVFGRVPQMEAAFAQDWRGVLAVFQDPFMLAALALIGATIGLWPDLRRRLPF